MCGRFTLTVDKVLIAQRFDLSLEGWDWLPRYNIAPTQSCLAIIEENGQHRILPLTWGLIPHWSKNKKPDFPLINARAETIQIKPAFRELFQRKRCLIPADGFYEWDKTNTNKIPYRITLENQALFAFAGLWDTWESKQGRVNTFTIITTTSNALVADLHDRMPVILKKEDETKWLDASALSELEPLLEPLPSKFLECYQVSTLVNQWKNDSPTCIKPVS